MPVTVQTDRPDRKTDHHLHLPLPNIPRSHPHHLLHALFPLTRPFKSSHDVAAQWLIQRTPEARALITAALRRGHYTPEEAKAAYRLYLLSHYQNGDAVGQTLEDLARRSASEHILITGPECFAVTLARAVDGVARKQAAAQGAA